MVPEDISGRTAGNRSAQRRVNIAKLRDLDEMNGSVGLCSPLIVRLFQNPAGFRVHQVGLRTHGAVNQFKVLAVINIWFAGNPTLNLQACIGAAENIVGIGRRGALTKEHDESLSPGLAHTPARTYRAKASGEKLAYPLQSIRPRFRQDILSALIAMARVGAFRGWCPLTSGASASARRPHLIGNS